MLSTQSLRGTREYQQLPANTPMTTPATPASLRVDKICRSHILRDCLQYPGWQFVLVMASVQPSGLRSN